MVSFPAVVTIGLVNLPKPMPDWFRKRMKGVAKILLVNSENLPKIPDEEKDNQTGVDHNIEVDAHELDVKSTDENHECANNIKE